MAMGQLFEKKMMFCFHTSLQKQVMEKL